MRKLAEVMAAGLVLGVGVGMLLTRTGPLDDAAMTLLEARCVPWLNRAAPPDLQGLEPINGPGVMYVDPRSRLLVEFGQQDCSVTDRLHRYSEAERAAVERRAVALAERIVPEPVVSRLAISAEAATSILSGRDATAQPHMIILRVGSAFPGQPPDDATTVTLTRGEPRDA